MHFVNCVAPANVLFYFNWEFETFFLWRGRDCS